MADRFDPRDRLPEADRIRERIREQRDADDDATTPDDAAYKLVAGGYLEIEEIPGESQKLVDDITGGDGYFKGVDGLKVNDAVKAVTDLKDADAVKAVTDLGDADAVKTVTDLKDADAVKTVVDHTADAVADPVGEVLEPLLGGGDPVSGTPDVESAMDASSPMFDESDLTDGL